MQQLQTLLKYTNDKQLSETFGAIVERSQVIKPAFNLQWLESCDMRAARRRLAVPSAHTIVDGSEIPHFFLFGSLCVSRIWRREMNMSQTQQVKSHRPFIFRNSVQQQEYVHIITVRACGTFPFAAFRNTSRTPAARGITPLKLHPRPRE